jgi:hypothetical protein
VMLRDADSARALLSEIDGLCAARPGLGLHAQRDRLAREIGSIPVAGDGQTARLTGADSVSCPYLAPTCPSARSGLACTSLGIPSRPRRSRRTASSERRAARKRSCAPQASG